MNRPTGCDIGDYELTSILKTLEDVAYQLDNEYQGNPQLNGLIKQLERIKDSRDPKPVGITEENAIA